MNQRDMSELKRRLNPEKRNPTMIRGCYVTHDGRVISTFESPVYNMPADENEKYMAIFKKAMSGTYGQNQLPIDFTYEQVTGSEEHDLLMRLRATSIKDEAAVDAFWQKVIVWIKEEHAAAVQSVEDAQEMGNYLILLMHDGYDLPIRNNNDELDREHSTEVFSYIVCAVCPVKQTKPELSYFAAESEFHNRAADWIVAQPDLGFLFPAFEERAANIHRAMYYSRSASDLHDGFVRSVFNQELLMTAAEQQETFQSLLQETLGDECSMDVVQAVHETMCTMIEETKADKHADPLALSALDVKNVLETCGVSETRAAEFEEKFTESFGERAQIPAVNMVPVKSFKVQTPSVSIQVAPDHRDLIETRMIDGKYYILVLADGDVEVNGMKINQM